jgi:hypothetical protein
VFSEKACVSKRLQRTCLWGLFTCLITSILPWVTRAKDPANRHYIVTQLDWIQPRYLFVKYRGAGPSDGSASTKPSASYRQDPKYAAQFPNGTPICIPIFALNSLSRHNLGVISRTDSDLAIFHLLEEKKRKRDADKMPTPDASKNNIVLEEDDVVSVATAFNALQILLSEVENEVEELPSKNSLNPELSKRNRFPCPSPSPMRNRIIDQGSSTTSPSNSQSLSSRFSSQLWLVH